MRTNPKKPKENLKVKVRPRPVFTIIDHKKTSAPAGKVLLYTAVFKFAGLFYRVGRRFRMVLDYREAIQFLMPQEALKRVNELETIRANEFLKRWAERMRRAGIIVINY